MTQEKPSTALPPRAAAPILLAYAATAIGILLWMGGIFLAPYLRARSSPWQSLAYAVFKPVCHQIPSRSFYRFGAPLAVCARCLGIYSGFLIGVFLYPLVRGFRRLALPQARVFLLASLPIVLDTLGNFFQLWNTSNSVRMVIGIVWGIPLPFYVITGIADLFLAHRCRRGNLGKPPGGSGKEGVDKNCA
jgi:uncharacterized membrane protein